MHCRGKSMSIPDGTSPVIVVEIDENVFAIVP
jgi:hypothetical protein